MINEKEIIQKLKEVSSSLKDLDFGTIEITVHNSRIVQIEVSEKFRFESKNL